MKRRLVFRTKAFEYPLIKVDYIDFVRAAERPVDGFPWLWYPGWDRDYFWPRPDPKLKGDVIEVYDDDEMPR